MAKKPKKDEETEDESLPYLQGTSVGSYSITVWADSDRIDPVIEKKEKKKKRIGFIDTNKKRP